VKSGQLGAAGGLGIVKWPMLKQLKAQSVWRNTQAEA
jgi:hypothetical protein